MKDSESVSNETKAAPEQLGQLTKQPLPFMGSNGLEPSVEAPAIALAPAVTFKPGERWRLHYGYCVDIEDGPGSQHLCHIFIRDDLSREETKQAVAEAWGWLLVNDFGDSFPDLIMPSVYRREGDAVDDTPWPVRTVPAHLWEACWRRTGQRKNISYAEEKAFDEWEMSLEATM